MRIPGRDAPENMTQNIDGKWVPSIPEPIYGLVYRCVTCRKPFFRLKSYRAHYALYHILKLRKDMRYEKGFRHEHPDR